MDVFEERGMRHYSRKEMEDEEAKIVRRYAIGVPLSILFLGTAACATVYGIVDLASPKGQHVPLDDSARLCVQNDGGADVKPQPRMP